MPNWRDYYKPPIIDWDALENWWPWEQDLIEVRAFYEQLLRDVPKQEVENGLDRMEWHADQRSAELGPWKRGAILLALGELEAAVKGRPKSMTEVWAERAAEISQRMAEVLSEEKVPGQAVELSAAWHAQTANDCLLQLDRYMHLAEAAIDEDDDDPEARLWMRERDSWKPGGMRWPRAASETP